MRKLNIIIALTLMLGLLAVPTLAVNFSDINNHWSKATVTRAANDGVAKGYPDGTFRPDEQVNESQFLALLIRTFAGIIDGTPWYQPYYDFAGDNNYPVSDKPEYIINRLKVAEIVAGTQGVNLNGNQAVAYLLAKGLAKGCDPSEVSLNSYQGAKALTRAEAVQFIYNIKDKGIQEIKERPFEPSDPKEVLTPTEYEKYQNYMAGGKDTVWCGFVIPPVPEEIGVVNDGGYTDNFGMHIALIDDGTTPDKHDFMIAMPVDRPLEPQYEIAKQILLSKYDADFVETIMDYAKLKKDRWDDVPFKYFTAPNGDIVRVDGTKGSYYSEIVIDFAH